ncbi:PREDICTED: COMM domain-containing protein 10-like isoform X1 [Polistes dominula]|uniref:COMM domain-containing protein 10-like isoform X1 n=1 Tax=Polistes dominula TaxID=743375 RepID=A0ABM1JE51_POLDO|nr:PREDICTED: COMM domain-containing protein 10-like isoform X1 [Polistes dominula]
MESWVTITPDLQQGLKIASRIDNGKFRLLVNRICQNLQFSSNGKPFSEEEEEKLLKSLELNKEELTFLLDAITFIYKQAAFNIVKPAAFESILKDTCHLDEDKTLTFVNSWLTYGKGIIKDLRKKSIFPKQVKDINWCLNIQSSSSTISKDVNPVALFQLDFTGEKDSKLTIEFDKKSLTDLYMNFEKIQNQLDALK